MALWVEGWVELNSHSLRVDRLNKNSRPQGSKCAFDLFDFRVVIEINQAIRNRVRYTDSACEVSNTHALGTHGVPQNDFCHCLRWKRDNRLPLYGYGRRRDIPSLINIDRERKFDAFYCIR